jgi:hypothetical protein
MTEKTLQNRMDNMMWKALVSTEINMEPITKSPIAEQDFRVKGNGEIMTECSVACDPKKQTTCKHYQNSKYRGCCRHERFEMFCTYTDATHPEGI